MGARIATRIIRPTIDAPAIAALLRIADPLERVSDRSRQADLERGDRATFSLEDNANVGNLSVNAVRAEEISMNRHKYELSPASHLQHESFAVDPYSVRAGEIVARIGSLILLKLGPRGTERCATQEGVAVPFMMLDRV